MISIQCAHRLTLGLRAVKPCVHWEPSPSIRRDDRLHCFPRSGELTFALPIKRIDDGQRYSRDYKRVSSPIAQQPLRRHFERWVSTLEIRHKLLGEGE